MTRFILSKAAGMLAVLAIVAVLVFVLTRAASGDPVAVLLGDQATAADIARVQKQYGLDQPLPTQFVIWLREVLHGNLGDSIFLQRPVTQALAERAEPTAAHAAGRGAGHADRRALRHRLGGVPRARGGPGRVGPGDAGRQRAQLLAGHRADQIFSVKMGWFPVSGYGEPGAPLAERLHALLLPAITLGLLNSALIRALHPRQHAGRAGRGLRAHRARQGLE
jgi:peptide/nickel transport system permease protein